MAIFLGKIIPISNAADSMDIFICGAPFGSSVCGKIFYSKPIVVGPALGCLNAERTHTFAHTLMVHYHSTGSSIPVNKWMDMLECDMGFLDCPFLVRRLVMAKPFCHRPRYSLPSNSLSPANPDLTISPESSIVFL